MQKHVKLQRAMVVNNRFDYATLERHTGLSRPFIRKKLIEYETAGFVARAGMGGKQEKLWRMTQAGRRQFDPLAAKELAITDIAGSRTSCAAHEPEQRLWAAIRELKRFGLADLQALQLANDTTTRQYVALLKRAGVLIGTRVKGKSRRGAPVVYTIAETAGELAPLMGRCFYLFNPNDGSFESTPMEKFEIEEEKKRPGGVDAP